MKHFLESLMSPDQIAHISVLFSFWLLSSNCLHLTMFSAPNITVAPALFHQGRKNLICMWGQVSAGPTMANNTEDVENNMVSIKECVTAALTLVSLSLLTCRLMIKHFKCVQTQFNCPVTDDRTTDISVTWTLYNKGWSCFDKERCWTLILMEAFRDWLSVCCVAVRVWLLL